MATAQGIFITGTDTGVGKTVVAATLAWALRRAGVDFAYLKPVETGIESPEHLARLSDAALVRRAGELTEPLSEIVPFTFPEPLAPLLAARRQNITLTAAELRDKIRSRLSSTRPTLVEGAGGLLAPLCPDYLVLDLIRDLELPVLVVSHTGLGAVNHTLLTLERLEREGLEVIGLIANHLLTEPGIAEREFISQIQEFSPVDILGELPGRAQPPTGSDDWQALSSCLDLDHLRQKLSPLKTSTPV